MRFMGLMGKDDTEKAKTVQPRQRTKKLVSLEKNNNKNCNLLDKSHVKCKKEFAVVSENERALRV